MKTLGKILYVILGILIIICGFYCLFTPTQTYATIGWAVGFSMVIDAVGRFCAWYEAKKKGLADGWMLAGAILSAVFGVLILSNEILQVAVDLYIAYFIAIWLIVAGIMLIVRANKIRKFHKNWDTKMLGTHWYLPLIIGILMIILGIICCFNPGIIAGTIGIIIGLGIIMMGADMITIATSPEDMLIGM